MPALIVSLARIVLSVGAGFLSFLALPPHGLWWAAIIGTGAAGLLFLHSTRHTWKTTALYGYGFGAGFFGGMLPWVGVYVGPAAWIALSAFLSLYTCLWALLCRYTTRVVTTHLPWAGTALPLIYGSLFSATEWLRSVAPFGGFPWGRIAFGQIDGPLRWLAPLGGVPLVGVIVVSIGCAGAMLVFSRIHDIRFSIRFPLVKCGAVVSILLATFAAYTALSTPTRWTQIPLDSATPREPGVVGVAGIQGNVPRLGLDFNAQRSAVLNNHISVTRDFHRAAVQPADIILWPENSSDISPLHNESARIGLNNLVATVRAPIIVGAVLPVDDPQKPRAATNTILVWDENGVGESHTKRFIQPFGEYLPLRPIFEALSESAAKAGQFIAGDGSGVVHAGGVAVGVATCFEIAFADATARPVNNGAQILHVPTNNATFGLTDMTYQQLAMSRFKALEHQIPTMVVATSGVSAIVDIDGSSSGDTEKFTPGMLYAQTKIGPTGTIATALSSFVEFISAMPGFLVIALGWAFSLGLVTKRGKDAVSVTQSVKGHTS